MTGVPLLPLVTRRPPDVARGEGIRHLELMLPAAIAARVTLGETGAAEPLGPAEAAGMLWAQPVAHYLDGRVDAWRDVPGVALLLPGLDLLGKTDETAWPTSQAALRSVVTAAAGISWQSMSVTLRREGVVGLLNDLVLLFKYAALGQTRPLRRVAELYRLGRALTTTTDVPGSIAEVQAWLRAPLATPRVLAALPDPPGPRPPAPDKPRTGPVFEPTPEVVDLLEAELARRDTQQRGNRVREALHAAGVRDAQAIGAVLDALADADGADGATAGTITSAAWSTARPPWTGPAKPHVVRTQVHGTPVLLDVGAARARIARARRETALALLAAYPPALRQRLAAAGVVLEDLNFWLDLILPSRAKASHLEPAGRSDLLLVRQTTTGYRRSEIAYIENVLVGETRSRQHTTRVLTRQEFIETIEEETEETRDLQVTDRSELSREVSKVVDEDLRAEGSVEVTSRGPTKVVASASVSFDRATEEAAATAETYARETIERAVKRTLQRISRTAKSFFEQETVEANQHAFTRDADADDHVSGVYQYLERISRAKLLWYGEREMYDLLVPEPAALIWHLAVARSELHLPVEQPDEQLFASLTVDNIGDKREEVIRAFRVTDLPEEPPEFRMLSAAFTATGNGDGAHYANSKDMQVPEGYGVESARMVVSAETDDPEDYLPNGGVAVGDAVEIWQIAEGTGSEVRNFDFPQPLPGPSVLVAFNADNYRSLVANIALRLKLTPEARRAWALNAYGRVAERFEQLRREYAQAVAAATANRPEDAVSLPVGARRRLDGIVRGELQRAAVDIMRNVPASFDMVRHVGYPEGDGTLGVHPVIDMPALHADEPEVRFLQQAFEWEHLAWVLYPYFWGRRSEWARTVVVDHPDPDFAAFLNAGAARLQIPVRPGFEDLVKHFMETGEVYGDGLPKMGDHGYLPFIDEQLTALGAPGDEVAWPPDAPREWDILAPTSLTLVRSVQEDMPRWDPTTGDEL